MENKKKSERMKEVKPEWKRKENSFNRERTWT